MSESSAKKIIDGLKQAAQSAKCEHDWDLVEGTTPFAGKPGKVVRKCAYCGTIETKFFA